VKRLETVQNGFKNSFGIIMTIPSCDWINIQMLIEGKAMRLFRADDKNEAIAVINDCYNKCINREKLDMQGRYFQNEIAYLHSAQNAYSIYKSTLMSLQVSPEDIEIIRDGFPTIAQLVGASSDIMKRFSPADVNSIDLITGFFHTTPTNSKN
jgi:hypothetical protein